MGIWVYELGMILPLFCFFSVILGQNVHFEVQAVEGAVLGGLQPIKVDETVSYFTIGDFHESFQVEGDFLTMGLSGVGFHGPYLASGDNVAPQKLPIQGEQIIGFNFFGCKYLGGQNEAEKEVIAYSREETAPLKDCKPVWLALKSDSQEHASDVTIDSIESSLIPNLRKHSIETVSKDTGTGSFTNAGKLSWTFPPNAMGTSVRKNRSNRTFKSAPPRALHGIQFSIQQICLCSLFAVLALTVF